MNLLKQDLDTWSKALIEQPQSPDAFMAWITDSLKAFFPFQRVFMAHGEYVAGQITLTHWQAIGHEPTYLNQKESSFELKKRGTLAWWGANRKPFVIDPNDPPPYATQFEIDEIVEYSLGNVAAHGILNAKANAGTYFSFTGVPQPLSSWHIDALRIITPVLNDLYLAQIAAETPLPPVFGHLTPRQKVIVRRVAAGHDNKTVARELDIAAQTVKNQLSLVYQKLGVHKRSQLIAMLR